MASKTNFYENIDMNYFVKYCTGKSFYEINYLYIKDDTELMNLLKNCESAKNVGKVIYHEDNIDFISFTIKSDIYGCDFEPNAQNDEIKVYEDGYLKTSELCNYYNYFIGKENAKKIIDYAIKNGVPKEMPDERPDYYHIAGVVTELNSKRIVINDEIMCKDKSDAMDFIYEFHSKEEAQGFMRNFEVGDRIQFCTLHKLSQNKIIKPYIVYKIKFNELEANIDISQVAEAPVM